MEQCLRKIEETYNRVAGEYAQAFFGEHEKKPKDREMLFRFSQEIGDKQPVWDFGCGPGQTTKYLHDLGMDVSGLDLSEKIVEEARRYYPWIHFQKGNILDLVFGNDTLAGVVAFYAIVHFTPDQVEKAFCEIFRVLKPGGLFLVAFHVGEETIHVGEFLGKQVDIDFMFFTVDFISGCLRRVGFVKIDIIEREPYEGVEYPSRRAYVFASKPVVVKSDRSWF